MLSHEPEMIRLLHREHVERLTQDAQRPIEATQHSSLGTARVLSRAAVLAHAALAVRHRRVYSKP
jgi:hypothetical protein